MPLFALYSYYHFPLLRFLNFKTYFLNNLDKEVWKWSEKRVIFFSILKQVCLPLCICLFAFQTLHFLVPGALDKELLCIFNDEIYFCCYSKFYSENLFIIVAEYPRGCFSWLLFLLLTFLKELKFIETNFPLDLYFPPHKTTYSPQNRTKNFILLCIN